MKTMLLTFMMVMGLAINYSNAQVACCDPCPPGCCMDKGCTPEDCTKMGCDISKCNPAGAKASKMSGKESKACCSTDAKASTTANKTMCCASQAKSTATVTTAASLFTPCAIPAQAPKTTLASLSVPQGQE